MMPAFYRDDKYQKMLQHWRLRLGLEFIKMEHLLLNTDNKDTRRKMKEQIEAYIAKAYDEDAEQELKDVYVTNHEPRTKKYFTTSA